MWLIASCFLGDFIPLYHLLLCHKCPGTGMVHLGLQQTCGKHRSQDWRKNMNSLPCKFIFTFLPWPDFIILLTACIFLVSYSILKSLKISPGRWGIKDDLQTSASPLRRYLVWGWTQHFCPTWTGWDESKPIPRAEWPAGVPQEVWVSHFFERSLSSSSLSFGDFKPELFCAVALLSSDQRQPTDVSFFPKYFSPSRHTSRV